MQPLVKEAGGRLTLTTQGVWFTSFLTSSNATLLTIIVIWLPSSKRWRHYLDRFALRFKYHSDSPTSQDGGDCTSITSGVESEMKKPVIGLLKTKKSSLKRKVQNFSHESDDAVVEPLLQKDKDKSQMPNQSAKHLLTKAKTESLSEVINDKDKLLPHKKNEKTLTSVPNAIVGASSFIDGTKESQLGKSFENSAITIHNHMNTNIFSNIDAGKSITLPKTKILVEIDGGKQSSYSPSPLIFTTAKIHSDGKTKHMEPVQVTPVPILSTIEGSVIKSGNISDINKFLSSIPNKGDALNASYVKPTIDSKLFSEQKHAKTTSAYSNLSYSGIPNRLSEPDENKCKNELNQQSLPSFITANDAPISVVTVDVNITLPANTIQPEMDVIGIPLMKIADKYDMDKNARASKSAVIKDSFLSNGNKIDMNKNIQPLCTSSLGQGPSDIGSLEKKSLSDISGKQLQRQKQAIIDDNNEDEIGSNASNKLHKDKIDSSPQKMQQDLGASISVVDKNKTVTKPATAGKSATISLDVTATPSTICTTTKSIAVTSPSKTEITTLPSVLTSSSCKSIEVTVSPSTNQTLMAVSKSLTNKPLSTTVSSLARTTASPSMFTGKPTSTKTSSTIKPVTTVISTNNPKKITDKIANIPLSTTCVANKISAMTAASTAKPTAKETTHIITTAKSTVLKTTVTSTIKPIGITSTSIAESSVTMSGFSIKHSGSSSGSTVKSNIVTPTVASQPMSTTLSSTHKPLAMTVKSPSITKTPTAQTTCSIATTLPTGYNTATSHVTKSSITGLTTKTEKSKPLNASQSTAKTVTDLASNAVKPITTSSSSVANKLMVKTQEKSNQSTLLNSSKTPVSKPTSASLTHPASGVSSKSTAASTNTASTTTSSVKQSSVKPSTSKLNSNSVPKFR